jgi:hypothetical protein
MQKRKFTLVSVVVLVLGVVTFAFAQFAAQHRELGIYDHQTGEFTPLHTAQSDLAAELPAVVPTTGTLVFKFTITSKTAIPKNGGIYCRVIVGVNGESSGYSPTEKGTGIAALVSGNTYTCTATVNYSWLLASPSTDKIVVGNEDVGVLFGYQFTATNTVGTIVDMVPGRESIQTTVAPFSVPANGVTTTENVSITL